MVGCVRIKPHNPPSVKPLRGYENIQTFSAKQKHIKHTKARSIYPEDYLKHMIDMVFKTIRRGIDVHTTMGIIWNMKAEGFSC